MILFEIFTLSGYVQWAGSLAIAVCCLLHYGKRPHYVKMLGVYAVVSAFFSLAQFTTIWAFSNVGVNAIGNAFVLSEAWCFAILFVYATPNSAFQKGILTLTILYTVFYATTLLFFSGYAYSFIRFGRDSLMIGYAVAYFYYLIRKLPEENLLRFPMFWINTAVIFFFSGTFILSLMVDYIVSVFGNDLTGFWTFRNFFRLAFCCVLAYAGWINLRSILKPPS